MKVKITNTKTNGWPEGSAIGDEVEVESVAGKLPAWAVGKCEVIDAEDAKAPKKAEKADKAAADDSKKAEK